MKPIKNISGLSQAANDRVLSITIEDSAGIKSDRVSIVLDDRDYKLEWPQPGQIVTVSLGYEETGLTEMGEFELDEPSYSEPPRTMTITGHAQKHVNSNIKAPQTQPWDEKTMGQVVGEIAQRNGYQPEVHPDVASIYFPHIDQTEESDVHLLTRLAEQHDCFVKYQDGKLQFKPREQTNGTITIDKGDSTSISGVVVNSRNKYDSVRAAWHNNDTNERTYETIGGGEGQQYDMRISYPTRDEAINSASSKHKQLKRGTGQIDSLQIPGNPAVRAEMSLVLIGFRPEICGIPWVISQATHTFSNSGYITTIKAEVDGSSVNYEGFEKAREYAGTVFN
jgi:phage protein D